MKILLAVDGSAHSDAAVAEVARRPWPRGSEVRVIIVDPPVDSGLILEESATVFDKLMQQQRSDARRYLQAAVDALKQASPDLTVTPILREGWPKEALLDEAERWKSDLIVVGSHGYGAIRRMFLGSVSLALATNAPCSVEIVRPPSDSILVCL